MSRTDEMLRQAQSLAGLLYKATGFAATPTVDGRVILYAPRSRADDALADVTRAVQHTPRTVRLVDVRDKRLAVVEVSGAR